jgi:hypothetical protein
MPMMTDRKHLSRPADVQYGTIGRIKQIANQATRQLERNSLLCVRVSGAMSAITSTQDSSQ